MGHISEILRVDEVSETCDFQSSFDVFIRENKTVVLFLLLIDQFLNENKNVDVEQSEFRPRHSTETCQTHLNDSIYECSAYSYDPYRIFYTIDDAIPLEK